MRNWRKRSHRDSERQQDAVNLKKLAEGLVQATAEKERLTELLKIAAGEQARLSSEMESAASAAVAGAVVRRKRFAGADREFGEARPPPGGRKGGAARAARGATGRAATNNGERREPAGDLPVAARGPRDEIYSTE